MRRGPEVGIVLGLLGILGALFAGAMVDSFAVWPPARGDAEDGPDPQMLDEDEFVPADSYNLLDGPPPDALPTDDPAGMPVSDDLPTVADPALTLTGGDGNDILDGLGGDDDIAGGAGNDLLGGRDGADWLAGAAGDDNLHGGAGDDVLSGGDGSDTLHGEDGADWASGGAGDDALYGHAGKDDLAGGDGDDSLWGGSDDDSLSGGDGADALSGGFGADLMAGGLGADVLDGGDGADTLHGSDADATDSDTDFLNGGEGDDLLFLAAGDHGNGGAGADAFALHEIQSGGPVAQITDFDPAEDSLVVLYDAALHPAPVLTLDQTDAGGVTLLLDGVPLVNLGNAGGLDLGAIQLRAA
jgi:Ca2+-binding RTX toxin-like protein